MKGYKKCRTEGCDNLLPSKRKQIYCDKCVHKSNELEADVETQTGETVELQHDVEE